MPWGAAYGWAVRAARWALPRVARGSSKLAAGVRLREEGGTRLRAWAVARREVGRPLVWVHAPSVGEGWQAQAVLQALRRRRPDVQVVYTYFSPSAAGWAARAVPADVVDALPWDLPERVDPLVTLLRPALLVFTKTEVWPALLAAARRVGARAALVAATLPPTSSRWRGPARAFLGPLHRHLDLVAAVSQADAARYLAWGLSAERVLALGDPRVDQVIARAAATDAARWAPLRQEATAVLVAGSTWPADEARLVPALAALRARFPGLRAVIVPHEPTPAHLAALEARLRAAGLPYARLGAASPLPPVVVVDRMGVLGELYAVADVAYVGGGFGRAGLHSVLEPAAFGVPILVGPRHGNAREAAALLAQGGARVAADTAALAAALAAWLTDDTGRRRAGVAARTYVEAHRGAADRIAARLEELLG